MNEPPPDHLNESNDDAFVRQLRAMAPAPITKSGNVNDDTFSIESILYQAGFDAGRQSITPGKRPGKRSSPPWMPVLAASLMTAIVALPIAYRVGQQSSLVPSPAIADRDGSQVPVVAADKLNSPTIPAAERLAPDNQAPDNTPALGTGTLIRGLALDWRSDTTNTSLSTGTLTAFQRLSIDSLPPSHWIASQGAPSVPRETMALGDLDKFTVTLGLQGNQR